MKFIDRGKGKVIKWNVEKGFGFLSVTHLGPSSEELVELKENVDDAFAHYSEINMQGFKKLVIGQIVEFDAYRTSRGVTARDIHIVGEAYDEEGDINGNVQ